MKTESLADLKRGAAKREWNEEETPTGDERRRALAKPGIASLVGKTATVENGRINNPNA